MYGWCNIERKVESSSLPHVVEIANYLKNIEKTNFISIFLVYQVLKFGSTSYTRVIGVTLAREATVRVALSPFVEERWQALGLSAVLR